MSITHNTISQSNNQLAKPELQNTLLPARLKELLQKADDTNQEIIYSKGQVSRFIDACCDCV
jgi:hypothetical protein